VAVSAVAVARAPRAVFAVRPARAEDAGAIRAILAPQIAAGTILRRPFAPGGYLVAEDGAGLVGAVAMRPWTSTVVELCGLVSARAGRGIGGALCEAVARRAAREGYGLVAVLTGAPGFFLRRRFQPVAATPQDRARGGGCTRGDPLGAAIAVQAKT
jgi:N-acetylglutamate synthase-like GNAT family acetyltransferase